jgi:AraC family transcriptional regulator
MELQRVNSAKLEHLPSGENPDQFKVSLRNLPAFHLAYVRISNSYQSGGFKQAFEHLQSWARATGNHAGRWFGYSWDDPDIVPLERCRYDLAVEVATPFRAQQDIQCHSFPAMTVAQLDIRGSLELEMRAIDWLYGSWIGNSGYLPCDQPCFEAWHGLPFAHGSEHFELSLWLPVERA